MNAMDYRQLGQTDLKVSALCLGTMTWGDQNTETQAHAQLDTAVAAGVNFIDVAEMYPIPPRALTYGLTETYIGNWLRRRNNRDKVIIATKVIGRAPWADYIREGNPCLDRKNIEEALDASLKRLQTEYIDLYQLHWPDRNTNFFGKLGYQHRDGEKAIPIEETLSVLGDLVKAGKVRYIGISNETPWGTMTFLHYAERYRLPRIVSIQNPYNLLNRTFEIGLAEIAHRDNVGLLAYSPLGFGVLSGKYLEDERPPGARLTLFKQYTRYSNPESEIATADYVRTARRHGLDPAQMALAYVTSRPFVISNIIGATTMEQLNSNLQSVEINLSEDIVADIEAIHRRQPNPSP